MSAHTLQALFEELPQNCQIDQLVAGKLDVRRAQDEGVVALVSPAVQKGGGFGVGTCHDDPRHTHHIQLEPSRVEALDLLVHRDQDFPALMAALLGAGFLIFDMVAGHARLDEAANEIADVGVATVTRVGVGNDEGAEVDRGGRGAFFFAHARAIEVLVAVGGEQGADDGRRFVGNLAQRIACQVGPGILRDRALGGSRPSPQVDSLDALAFDGHGLPR